VDEPRAAEMTDDLSRAQESLARALGRARIGEDRDPRLAVGDHQILGLPQVEGVLHYWAPSRQHGTGKNAPGRGLAT